MNTIHMKQKILISITAGVLLLVSCKNRQENSLATVDYQQIRIEGELHDRAMKNFDRLESEIYTPENVYPEKHHHTSANWAGDKEGRIILGLVLQAQATHREPRYLQELIDLYPSKTNSGGYLGALLGETIDEQQLSGHGWLLRGMCEYYLWKRDEKVAGYIKDIINNLALPTKGFHATYPINPEDRRKNVGHMAGTRQNIIGKWMLSSDVGCDLIFLDGVVQAYELFPNAETKELIDEIIARFMEMDLLKIKAQTHASLTGTRALIRYYNITKEPQYLNKAIEIFDLYLSDGMTSNFENFNWFARPTWTEPCAIIDSYMAAMQLWEATQKPKYINTAHLIYYNALGHTQRANGGYGCDNTPYTHGQHSLKVHADEAWWCCTMRGGEGLASAIKYNYYQEGATLVIPSFHNNQLTMKDYTLTQTTDYPFSGKVNFEINASNSFSVPLKIFIPSWAKEFKLTQNDIPVEYKLENGFIEVNFKGEATSLLKLNFDMEQKIVEQELSESEDAVVYQFMSGPLLLGAVNSDKEIVFTSTPKLLQQQQNLWIATDGTNKVSLNSVYHLLDPLVSKESKYQKQILFTKTEEPKKKTIALN